MDKTGKRSDFLSIILGVYVLLIGAGIPLVVKNLYFDILVIKYYFYCFCTILMIIMLLVYSVTIGKTHTVLYLKRFSIKFFLKNLSMVDYAVLIFYIVSIISTVSSDYLYESFWGNEGRFTGLFLISLYVFSYFCISKFWKFNKLYINIILITGVLVCLFGITDYFQLDIFHFKAPMLAEQRPIFTSTIGNINTYTAYVGMITAIAAVLFVKEDRSKHMIGYYICMVISFFAIIMGVSDNAYLSLGALFGLLPLYVFNNNKGIKRFLIIIATFFSVMQIIDWINVFYSDIVLGIDSVFNMIIDSGILSLILAGFWGVIIIWYLVDYKTKSGIKEYGNIFRYIWLIFIFLIVSAVIYAMYDCNVLGNSERYGGLSNYLIFNDDWGTHRGYIWRNAMECFKEFSTWKKVIGFGPETFGIILLEKTKFNPFFERFDSAHNEYLHLLLTVGIAGLASYLLFICAYLKGCFGYRRKNHYFMAIAFGVICYSIQAFVNLNLPIVTPIFWLFMGMGAAKSIAEQ